VNSNAPGAGECAMEGAWRDRMYESLIPAGGGREPVELLVSWPFPRHSGLLNYRRECVGELLDTGPRAGDEATG
jgi:hypothetical protein